MLDYASLEHDLSRQLGLARRPVAITFLDRAPEGVKQFTGSQPSGCSFWKLAAESGAFFTAPSDHYNCAIGCFTHNIPLPQERAAELDQTLGLMVELGYVRPQELPGMARLSATPGVVVYAPLGEAPVEPQVVLFAGRPGRVMLLQEAAWHAGCAAAAPYFGRPTCMALPAALESSTIASGACAGNRVYTGLGEDELYLAVRGRDLPRIAAELGTIIQANQRLTEYHQERLVQLRG